MDTRRRDSGFAMPVAIFALVVLGVLVTGGFYMARQEARIGSASEHGSLAFYLAEKGMNRVLLDYDAEDFRAIPILSVDTIEGTEDEGEWTVEIVKRSDTAKGFELIPRRWVVERTFAWLGRCRRLAKDWEKSVASAEAWLLVAHIRLVTRRLARYCYGT